MLKKSEIAQNLRLFVEKNFSSYTEVAGKLGMTLQAFKNYYGGRSIPGGEILAKLADLGCDLNWLLTNKTIIGGPLMAKEPNEPYTADEILQQYKDKINELQEDIIKLKAENFDLIKERDNLLARIDKLENSQTG